MNVLEKSVAITAYFAAIGIAKERVAYCIPFLTGEKSLPMEDTSPDSRGNAPVRDRMMTYTLTDAAKKAGVSRTTIWRLVREGRLTAVNIRGRNRIREIDLENAFAPHGA